MRHKPSNLKSPRTGQMIEDTSYLVRVVTTSCKSSRKPLLCRSAVTLPFQNAAVDWRKSVAGVDIRRTKKRYFESGKLSQASPPL